MLYCSHGCSSKETKSNKVRFLYSAHVWPLESSEPCFHTVLVQKDQGWGQSAAVDISKVGIFLFS